MKKIKVPCFSSPPPPPTLPPLPLAGGLKWLPMVLRVSANSLSFSLSIAASVSPEPPGRLVPGRLRYKLLLISLRGKNKCPYRRVMLTTTTIQFKKGHCRLRCHLMQLLNRYGIVPALFIGLQRCRKIPYWFKKLERKNLLKGVCHEIFDLYFFFT